MLGVMAVASCEILAGKHEHFVWTQLIPGKMIE